MPGTNDPRSLVVLSSEREWEKTGRSLFKQKRYAHAVQCFQRASLDYEAKVATAYLRREEAQEVPHSRVVQRNQAFTDAAKTFIESARSSTSEKATYYRIAAECFKECANLPKAAQYYVYAGEYGIGAQLYRDAGMFSDAILVVQNYKHKVPRDIADQIEFASRLYFFLNLELKYVCQILPFQLFLLTLIPQTSSKVILF
jgi:tetratricopeptide (TPR) repeat protein